MLFFRRFSICQRVFYGLSLFGVLAMLLGLCAGWSWTEQAQQLRLLAREATGDPQLVSGRIEAVAAAAQAQARVLITVALAVGVLGIMAAIALRASIKAPIEGTIQSIIQMGSGDLLTKISSPGRDEVAWMNAELNGMRKKLQKMVASIGPLTLARNTAAQNKPSSPMPTASAIVILASIAASSATAAMIFWVSAEVPAWLASIFCRSCAFWWADQPAPRPSSVANMANKPRP